MLSIIPTKARTMKGRTCIWSKIEGLNEENVYDQKEIQGHDPVDNLSLSCSVSKLDTANAMHKLYIKKILNGQIIGLNLVLNN